MARVSQPRTTLWARWALAFLPDKQRAAVLLHKYHRMDYLQIAKVLNCRESAARSLLLSAYETLRRKLAASDRELTGFSGESTRFQNGLIRCNKSVSIKRPGQSLQFRTSGIVVATHLRASFTQD
jgi:Sigma-70, region 4